jgi:hypothetical protein
MMTIALGIGSFSDPIVRREEYIRTFAALSRRLKTVDDLILRLYFYRSSDLFIEGFAEVAQGMKRSITSYPD